MSASFDTSRDRVSAGRRLGTTFAVALLPMLAGASGAKAFGLEQLTVSAPRIIAKDALATLAARERSPASAPHQQGRLVSQDRSTLDLSALPMSAFGDAEEASR